MDAGDDIIAIRGEQALWRAVTLQALTDAVSISQKPEAIRHKREALHWLTSTGRNFETVCELAGYSATDVRSKVRRALKRNCVWRARNSRNGQR